MISKEEIINKIGVLLKELSEKFDLISNSENDIHPLEFQLFEVNATYFAEHTNLLRKLEEETHVGGESSAIEEPVENDFKENNSIIEGTNNEDSDKEIEKDKEIIFTPAVSNEISEKETIDSQEIVEEIPEEKEDEPNKEEPLKEEPSKNYQEESNPTKDVLIEKEPTLSKDSAPHIPNEPVQETRTEEKPVNEPEKEIVKEIVIEEKKVNVTSDRPMSLNERLSEQRNNMGSDKSRQYEAPQRIKDIKSVISLNDKLLFIKDLFNGYSLAYSEAIELLNRYESFADADRFLKANYAEKNSWETKQASVDKLYAILRKRYG